MLSLPSYTKREKRENEKFSPYVAFEVMKWKINTETNQKTHTQREREIEREQGI